MRFTQDPANLRSFRPGDYLTDGRELFRVVSHLEDGSAHSDFTALEDCRTLTVHPYAGCELDAMGLRSVRASSDGRGEK